MHPQSALAFLVAFAAATPVLAQCRDPVVKKDIKCTSEGRHSKCDEERLVAMCPPGQRTNWRFLRDRCDTVDICEYEVSGADWP